MINIDSKLLDALKSSTCFGIGHDLTTPECKQCDVQAQCKNKKEGSPAIIPPKIKPKPMEVKETPKEDKKTPAATKTTTTSSTSKPSSKPSSKPAAKTQTTTPGDAPDFKPMSLDEIKEIAKERSVEWKDYGNDSITRMRLIMAVRASYTK